MKLHSIMWLVLFSLSARGDNFIFDIFGVLVHIPTSTQIFHTGIINPLGYVLLEQKNIAKLKSDFMGMLGKIKVTEDSLVGRHGVQATAQGLIMPSIMFSWQAGKLHYRDAMTKIEEHLKSESYGDHEANLFHSAAHLAFDLDTRKQSYKLLDDGVKLLKRLHAEKAKDGSRRHRFYVLSNMDEEMMAHLTATYPDVFGLFDGIVYSARENVLKPDHEIFLSLLRKFNLAPEDCVMIDDQQENIDAAVELNMRGILFATQTNVVGELERNRLVSPQASTYVALKSITACVGVVGFIFGISSFW